MSNDLSRFYPTLGASLGTVPLAELPTPVSSHELAGGDTTRTVLVKHDDVTGRDYGGNKVRKLEYVFRRARDRGATRIATFGAVGSNHAAATALYATKAGFACTCLLAHQSLKPGLGRALRLHQQIGTEVIKWGGSRADRVRTMRAAFQGRNTWVIPLGGSSWLGTVGIVNAGLELAAQIDAGDLPCPKRVYVALGTMGTAAGLALGFALAGLDTEVQAIRVTDHQFANDAALRRLMAKTATLMHRSDPSIPSDLASRSNIVCRHEFFGPGYGRSDETTDAAVARAHSDLGLRLDTTYTGKTIAALFTDLESGDGDPVLFWNTYNSRPLAIDDSMPIDLERMPEEFSRYFD